jgi:hypothetical protein
MLRAISKGHVLKCQFLTMQHLEVLLMLRVCSGSSIYAASLSTVETDFWKLLVGWLAIVPKFEGHLTVMFFVSVISFYGKRRNLQGAHTGK